MTEVALAPDTTPQPPAMIVQLLQKLAVPFQVRQEQADLNPAQRVQAVLLEDELGALLALGFDQEAGEGDAAHGKLRKL